MATDPAALSLPDDPALPPDVRTIRAIIRGLDTLRQAVADLAHQHADLKHQVTSSTATPVPGVLRWAQLDRDTAAQLWSWLIDWVGWAVHHFHLQEEIPPCWPRHWPLVEELTGLCASWHVATDTDATADALLRWLEALHRARPRLRDWDDHTKCRNGTHTVFHADLSWPDSWRDDALRWASADCATRPTAPAGAGDTPAQPAYHVGGPANDQRGTT